MTLTLRPSGWTYRRTFVLYDEETGTLRPKNADGSFLEPFDPDAATIERMWRNRMSNACAESDADAIG